MSAQLPLDLKLPARQAREDFLPAPANEAALAWIDRWPDWPGPALVIHGPEGAGKSHLAAIWAARAVALSLPPAAWLSQEPRALLGTAKAVVLEDLDRALLQSPSLEKALYGLWQALVERQGQMLVTAREAPQLWPMTLPDLASRLRGASSIAVKSPDEALLAALLVKLLADRQISAPPDVVSYLVLRSERSFAAIRHLALALDQAGLAQRRAITLPLARDVLAQLEK